MINVAASSSRREQALAAVAIAVCVAGCLAGLVDHLVTDSAVRLANLQAHYCIHGPQPPGVDCGAVDPDGLTRAWHWREAGYVTAIVAAALALVFLALRGATRSRRSTSPSSGRV